jgi:hypothetical protein
MPVLPTTKARAGAEAEDLTIWEKADLLPAGVGIGMSSYSFCSPIPLSFLSLTAFHCLFFPRLASFLFEKMKNKCYEDFEKLNSCGSCSIVFFHPSCFGRLPFRFCIYIVIYLQLIFAVDMASLR